jgi:hypothetical protein
MEVAKKYFAIIMDAFSPTPPDWTETATHGLKFCCPSCKSSPAKAQRVWLNRRAPTLDENHQRKWQEFYQCECNKVWWAWSNDRPPSDLIKGEDPSVS